MKARLIAINWVLSFSGLSIDMERSCLWIILAGVVWFIGSSILLIYVDKQGWMNEMAAKRDKTVNFRN